MRLLYIEDSAITPLHKVRSCFLSNHQMCKNMQIETIVTRFLLSVTHNKVDIFQREISEASQEQWLAAFKYEVSLLKH